MTLSNIYYVHNLRKEIKDIKEELISDALITCVCFDFNKQCTQPVYDLIKNDYQK